MKPSDPTFVQFRRVATQQSRKSLDRTSHKTIAIQSQPLRKSIERGVRECPVREASKRHSRFNRRRSKSKNRVDEQSGVHQIVSEVLSESSKDHNLFTENSNSYGSRATRHRHPVARRFVEIRTRFLLRFIFTFNPLRCFRQFFRFHLLFHRLTHVYI